jgi:hypothetical protein
MSDEETPMPEEKRSAIFKAETTEQFASIGRFVQEFELLVDALRSFPVLYLSDGIPRRQRLISIILHHQVMTAGPLMAIYRNMIFEMLTQEGAAQSQQEKDATRSVLRHICTRVQKLTETRNELLHGTWFIGWARAEETDSSTMSGRRLEGTKQGLEERPLPETVAAMDALTEEARSVKDLVLRLQTCFYPKRRSVRGNFTQDGDHWLPRSPTASSS